ncbi:hypothetical protein Droror1_Dr00020408 [Drosera rotundifolia]
MDPSSPGLPSRPDTYPNPNLPLITMKYNQLILVIPQGPNYGPNWKAHKPKGTFVHFFRVSLAGSSTGESRHESRHSPSRSGTRCGIPHCKSRPAVPKRSVRRARSWPRVVPGRDGSSGDEGFIGWSVNLTRTPDSSKGSAGTRGGIPQWKSRPAVPERTI